MAEMPRFVFEIDCVSLGASGIGVDSLLCWEDCWFGSLLRTPGGMYVWP
jgi:hypothetical protein